MTDDQIRTEDGRLDVLNALYARRTGAHEDSTIAHVFLVRRDYSLKEVQTWLADLVNMGLVEALFPHDHSAIKVWKISGKGITFKERGGQ